jgi:hypothetical protein
MQVKSGKPPVAAHLSIEGQKKYPLKWAICYLGKPYISLYGKKKAYDLLYHLNQSFIGLSVIPLVPDTGSAERKPRSLMKCRNTGRQRLYLKERRSTNSPGC